MIKKKAARVIAFLVVFVLMCSNMVITSFASGSLIIDAVLDIRPGGDGVAFYDNPNEAGSRGFEGNSLGACLRNTEWITYSLSDLTPGTYRLNISTANTNSASFRISINDTVVFSKVGIPATGSYSKQVEKYIGDVEITEPNSVLKIENVSSSASYVKQISLIDPAEIAKKEAFLNQGRPYKLAFAPCTIEAENFDAGKNGEAYYDSDNSNAGGKYRNETAVDIYEASGATYVNILSDEWIKYTVNVTKAGNYNLNFKWYDCMESSKVRIYANGYEIIRNVPQSAMPTGGFKITTAGTVKLSKGTHTFIIKCMEGDINIDYLRLANSRNAGIDVSDTANLRPWAESQVLSDEDLAEEVIVENPVMKELYVDAQSKTNGNGSQNNPFNTIEAAKAHVKTLTKGMTGDIIVNLKGDFKVDETINFTIEDSGEGIYRVIYRGDGDTTIHGGRKVTGWKQVEGSKLWQTTLPDVDSFRQLYIGENRGVRSQSKWLYWIDGDYDDPELSYDHAEGFYLKGEDFPQEFSKPQYMEMVWLPSWKNIRISVKSIEKQDDGRLLAKFYQPEAIGTHTATAPISAKTPYYIENAPEFLDEPGEYYFDRDTKILTYYPTEDEDMNTIECFIPETEVLLHITGTDKDNTVKNISFEGVQFKYAGWEEPTDKAYSVYQAERIFVFDDAGNKTDMLIPAHVQVDYAEGVYINKNSFRHLGAVGLSINNQSILCRAEGNLFDDLSASAITIGDFTLAKTDPLSEYTRKITVKNNLIRRCSVEYMTPIITGYYVNNVSVDHNDIKDAPYTGVSMGWGWSTVYLHSSYNKVTNNKIENVLYKIRDGGHIYTLGESKGGLIKGNYLVKSDESKGGIYHDNGSAYIKTTQNVFEETPKWLKITFGNIHDNVAYDNYSETPFVNKYANQNNISPATGKVNGEWPDEAKAIINNAGLEDEYKYLLNDYNNMKGLRNPVIARQPYQKDPGVYIQAGNYMDGGEGVAYHEVFSNPGAMARGGEGEPSVEELYDGTGGLRVMVTGQGEWTKYKFNVDEAGEYDIFTKLAVVSEQTAITIEVDDKVVTDKLKLTPNCTNYGTFTDYEVGKVHLEPGEHTIKVVHAVANFGFESLRIAKEGDVLVRNDGFLPEIMNIVIGK